MPDCQVTNFPPADKEVANRWKWRHLLQSKYIYLYWHTIYICGDLKHAQDLLRFLMHKVTEGRKCSIHSIQFVALDHCATMTKAITAISKTDFWILSTIYPISQENLERHKNRRSSPSFVKHPGTRQPSHTLQRTRKPMSFSTYLPAILALSTGALASTKGDIAQFPAEDIHCKDPNSRKHTTALYQNNCEEFKIKDNSANVGT